MRSNNLKKGQTDVSRPNILLLTYFGNFRSKTSRSDHNARKLVELN